MTEPLDTGALPASGRFVRMEAALERIEAKLDLKADLARVASVEARQTALEQLLTDMMTGKTTSALGQLYLNKFTDMEKTIELLEEKDRTREVLAAAGKDRVDSRFRWMAAGFGAMSALSVVISVIGLVT